MLRNPNLQLYRMHGVVFLRQEAARAATQKNRSARRTLGYTTVNRSVYFKIKKFTLLQHSILISTNLDFLLVNRTVI